MAALSEKITGGGCPAILPDNGVVDGATRGTFPDYGGFPLVRHTDGSDLTAVKNVILHDPGGHIRLCVPDLAGIVFDPTGTGVMLAEFPLRRGDNGACIIENDRTRTGRSLIEG